jgi:hypothetical protein
MKIRTGDFDQLNRTIADLAATKGIVELPVSTDLSRRYSDTTVHHKFDSLTFGLADEDVKIVCDIMWDLVVEGVLRPGLADGKSFHFPEFHVPGSKA